MDASQLEKIGLKEKEAKIYIALLKEGQSLANTLAKKTNILRSSIYDYLDVLLGKGFVSYTIISGKKYFQAINPQKILDSFQEKKNMEEDALKQIIPELTSLKNLAEKKADVEVFEGKEGMKSAMSYILKENPKAILAYGSSGVSYKLLPFFMEHWHKQRIKQKISVKIIYNDVSESKNRIKKGPSLALAKIRFSKTKDVSLTGTILYNDKVLITMWNQETPLAISIESKDIAKNYKANFEILWKASK
ncbi:MAG: helix-turn-helix domain-containing protein [Nanoarchaeota archaeon]|nr:helix-turn-helix domain-containing protein [Nanoarchaeota archaeon]